MFLFGESDDRDLEGLILEVHFYLQQGDRCKFTFGNR
jgi:hypothetical protein